MIQLGRHFALSAASGSGVCCDETGLFVGDVPLLTRTHDQNASEQWQPRPVFDLNRDLSKRYGLPIDCNTKTRGLNAVAQALNRGDILHARIVALHLQFPDPPALNKVALDARDIIDLARQLRASGLLKAGWDPLKHPRWPAGTPGSIGGEFAPRDGEADLSATEEPSTPVISAQLRLPIPPELMDPRELLAPRETPSPYPSEITPGPLAPPNTNPITIPRNPYPGRPKCVREWREATKYCMRLWEDGQLGRDYIRGQGTTVAQCIRGRVSADCGGNAFDA